MHSLLNSQVLGIQSLFCIICIKYEGHPESKERLHIQSAHLFCCSRSLVSGIQFDVQMLPHAAVRRTLSHGKCPEDTSLAA